MFSAPNTQPLLSTPVANKPTEIKDKPIESEDKLSEIEIKQKELFSSKDYTLSGIKFALCPDDQVWDSLTKAVGKPWQELLLHADEWMIQNAASKYKDRSRYIYKSGNLLYCFQSTGNGALDATVFLITRENNVAKLHQFFSIQYDRNILPSLGILPFRSLDPYEYPSYTLFTTEQIESWRPYGKEIARQLFALSLGKDLNAIETIRHLTNTLNKDIGEKASIWLLASKKSIDERTIKYYADPKHKRSQADYLQDRGRRDASCEKKIHQYHTLLAFDEAVLKKYMPLPVVELTPAKISIYSEMFNNHYERPLKIKSMISPFTENLKAAIDFHIDIQMQDGLEKKGDTQKNSAEFGMLAYSYQSGDDKSYYHTNFEYFGKKEDMIDFNKHLQQISKSVRNIPEMIHQRKFKGCLYKINELQDPGKHFEFFQRKRNVIISKEPEENKSSPFKHGH